MIYYLEQNKTFVSDIYMTSIESEKIETPISKRVFIYSAVTGPITIIYLVNRQCIVIYIFSNTSCTWVKILLFKFFFSHRKIVLWHWNDDWVQAEPHVEVLLASYMPVNSRSKLIILNIDIRIYKWLFNVYNIKLYDKY